MEKKYIEREKEREITFCVCGKLCMGYEREL